MDLKDKIAVISGAASGIGLSLAIKAAGRGARVALVDIDGPGAEQAADSIRASGGQALAYQADTTDFEAMQALADRIEADHGRVNIVFNNAGVMTAGPLTKTRPQDFAWLFDVNVRGFYNAILAFMPALERAAAAADLAHIVNTGSENSVALPSSYPLTAYTATKHAVLAISDGLRRDLAGSGIGVTIFCPSVVQTALWNSKRTRQEQFGGPRQAPAEYSTGLARGRTPEATVDTVFEGLDAGEFMIITDPRIRSFTETRLEEIARALDVCDERVTL